MNTILVFAIISTALFLCGYIVLLSTDYESNIGLIILICGSIGLIATYSVDMHCKESIDTETEVIVTELPENITEDSFITECSNDTTVTPQETQLASEDIAEDDSETEESILFEIIVCLLVFAVVAGPAILDIGSDFFEEVVYDIKESIRASKEKKEAKADQEKDVSFEKIKESFSDTERKTLKNLASSDSKVEYILWSVNYLDQNGREDNIRKLNNYYIPEILKANEQFKKVKSYGMDEMTAEAKKHYKKIISLAYNAAKAEVKKAASEILMDMDCNADVCENIYKKDGYFSMQEEIEKEKQEKRTDENKKEKELHVKSAGRDTLVLWEEEAILNLFNKK